jgi:predicted methyltransferase
MTASAGMMRYVLFLTVLLAALPGWASEQSVRPGINEHYQDPDFDTWVGRFESEGREVYDRRQDIINALALASGMAVADIGAGTGLFTRLISEQVGSSGRVYAVDISRVFVDNVLRRSRELGQNNVTGVVNTSRDTGLAAASIDLAFLCDTYHHFEYPRAMLSSIHQALRPRGRLVVIDYRKIPGFSSNWVMNHVRLKQVQVVEEIEAAGFTLVRDEDFLQQNYFLEFEKQ